MFANLIESGSHAQDVRRKSSFFLLTITGYITLILASFVASIYAYDARLEQSNLEALALIENPVIRFIEPDEMLPAAPKALPKSATTDIITRAAAIAPINRPDITPVAVSTTANTVASLPSNTNVLITGRDRDGGGSPIGIPNGNNNPLGEATGESSVKLTTAPPLPPVITKKAAPETIKPPPLVSKGVVNGLATYKPEPPYPIVARQARVFGLVKIQILIDERGKVISAQALSGHALLRTAALDAARRARFTPTKLSDVPVKVQGVITYNFKLE